MSFTDGDSNACLLIGDHNWEDFVDDTTVDGEKKGRGLIPRNYQTHPVGFYGAKETLAVDMPLIPDGEWAQRLKDMEDSQSSLVDLRNSGWDGGRIPSRDQNGKGYCWAHSGTSAHLLIRARDGQPYADLSAYAIACIIKQFQDEGGWGAQGVDFQVERGCPTAKYWAQQSMSRSNDNPETWADAAKHKIIEGWWDLNSAQYDRNLTWQQVMSALLSRTPLVCDFNWWSHSVCGAKPVNGANMRKKTRTMAGKLMSLKAFDKAWGMNHPVTMGFGLTIWNSWGDSWSDAGMGNLAGSKAIPDGCVAPRTVGVAA